jgi:hypothetical protein
VTYGDIQENGTAIRTLYAEHQIELPSMSGLGELVRIF